MSRPPGQSSFAGALVANCAVPSIRRKISQQAEDELNDVYAVAIRGYQKEIEFWQEYTRHHPELCAMGVNCAAENIVVKGTNVEGTGPGVWLPMEIALYAISYYLGGYYNVVDTY